MSPVVVDSGLSDADVERREWQPPVAELSREELFSTPILLHMAGGGVVITVSNREPAWMRPAVQALATLATLRGDWSSHGSRPIDKLSIWNALQLLGSIMDPRTVPPSVVPTSQGGVQLEWHIGGIDLEIEIESSGRCEFVFSQGREEIEGVRHIGQDDELRNLVGRLPRMIDRRA